MPTYTVHAAPPRAGETASDPQRFVFVRDGFHFWAFALAPLWLLVHRLWLVLLGYVAASVLIGGVFYVVGASARLEISRHAAVRTADRLRGGDFAALDADAARLAHARLRGRRR